MSSTHYSEKDSIFRIENIPNSTNQDLVCIIGRPHTIENLEKYAKELKLYYRTETPGTLIVKGIITYDAETFSIWISCKKEGINGILKICFRPM